MDLRAYLRLIRLHWVAVVLLVALGAGAGAVWAEVQRPTYAAKAQMLVAVSSPRQDSSEAYQGALLAQQRARSYVTLLTSQAVLRQIRDELKLPYSVNDMKSHVSAGNPTDTAIIDVTAEDHSADRALLIAEGVAPVFDRVVSTAENPVKPGSRKGDGSPAISVRMVERAELMDDPVSPRKAFDIMLGLVVGLVLGVGWAVTRELSGGPVRDPEDVAHANDADHLGLLGLLGVLPSEKPHGKGGRRSAEAVEAYRWLALTLEAAGGGRVPQSFVLTTPTGGEKAARVAAGLAEAVAESGSRVLVVDAGETGTDLARLLGLSTTWGLRDVLEHRVPVDRALVPWRDDVSVKVLSGGPGVPAAAAWSLRQADIARLCRELGLRADVVLIAGPAVLEGSAGTILSRAVGRAVLLVEAKRTRLSDVTLAAQRLRSVGVTVLGTVLTGAKGHHNRRPYVPTVPPSPRLDGHDHRPDKVQPRTTEWHPAARPHARLGPREET